MARTLTGAFSTAINAQAVAPILLAKADFDSGALAVWSGYGDLTWDGITFTGAGALLGLAGVQETAADRANAVQLALTGIDAALISLALTEEYQGRSCTVWLGALSGRDLIADPVKLFAGFMDVLEHSDSGETADFVMTVETKYAPLQRANPRRWTPEDQRIVSATDTGFDQVPSLQDAEVVWGR